MNLEVGNYYRTRDGRKARVICNNRRNSKGFHVIVAVTNGDEEEYFDCLCSGHFSYSEEDDGRDIIAEWTEDKRIVRHDVYDQCGYLEAEGISLHKWPSKESFIGFEYANGDLATIAPVYDHDDVDFGIQPLKITEDAKLAWPVAVLQDVNKEPAQ